MLDQFQKAIKLAKKTGDRLIVFDPANSELAYVIMTLEEYERLVLKRSEVKDLTEDELLDKINRDIAIWKSEQDFGVDIDISSLKNNLKDNFISSKEVIASRLRGGLFNYRLDQMKDMAYANKPDTLNKDQRAEEIKSKWTIPSGRKRQAEEIIEEDTHYLEEITF
ncbi:MAG: hypothetical protein NTW06_04635 [Candidatus Falkowbacteria bacterium]|nr:hypothetical protein [Candidatus Falkowbacteria bacterium]